jgi:hypothetical protein
MIKRGRRENTVEGTIHAAHYCLANSFSSPIEHQSLCCRAEINMAWLCPHHADSPSEKERLGANAGI